MTRRELTGVMLRNTAAIGKDRSHGLALARSVSGVRCEGDIRRACWKDVVAVLHVKWTLQERLFHARKLNRRNLPPVLAASNLG